MSCQEVLKIPCCTDIINIGYVRLGKDFANIGRKHEAIALKFFVRLRIKDRAAFLNSISRKIILTKFKLLTAASTASIKAIDLAHSVSHIILGT